MYNNTIARARKDSQGQRRNCRMSAASQAPHIPRAMRIAERDAEYRQHQSPNRGSQTAQPASSDWHESKNMREGPPSSKESKSPRCNGQHSGCRRRRPMLPYMLPLRQPSLLLLLGWPPVRLVPEVREVTGESRIIADLNSPSLQLVCTLVLQTNCQPHPDASFWGSNFNDGTTQTARGLP